METRHKIEGETFLLLPDKAMIWEDKKMLILADLHLGKITHFRKKGIPLPKEGEKDNYERFSFLILNYEVETILILGDLFHSVYNSEWPSFLDFLDHFPDKNFILVKGNHDILDDSKYVKDNLVLHEEFLEIPPFKFTHHPEKSELYNICGHIHPSVRMQGKGLQSIRIACYYFSEHQAILPAFGVFTGTHSVDAKEKDDIFAITANRVLKVF